LQGIYSKVKDGFLGEKMEESLVNFILDNYWEPLGKNNPNYFPSGNLFSYILPFWGRGVHLSPFVL
jgi:hypothetical protein